MTDRAKDADRLLSEPLLNEALDAIRKAAQEALCEVEPTSANEIARLQAFANCAVEFREYLRGAITLGQANGFSPNEPTREDPGS